MKLAKKNKLPQAKFQGDLIIGDYIFPCAVLEDGTRIIKETSITKTFSAYGGRNYRVREQYDDSGQLPLFLALKCLIPFIDGVFDKKDLMAIEYKNINGYKSIGYSATILPKICEIWLIARDQGKIKQSQLNKVLIAEVMIRSLAKVGITALVDEATGYQYQREAQELQKIFQAYISEELRAWQKMFPDEFYRQIFRLNGWDYNIHGIKKRPMVIGKWTNKLVYNQLEKGVAAELKRITPKNARMHQKLTENFGVRKLKEQIQQALMLLKISKDMKEVWSNLDLSKKNSNMN